MAKEARLAIFLSSRRDRRAGVSRRTRTAPADRCEIASERGGGRHRADHRVWATVPAAGVQVVAEEAAAVRAAASDTGAVAAVEVEAAVAAVLSQPLLYPERRSTTAVDPSGSSSS